MPKHRSRKLFKSFFGSQVDPGKDEELKGTKAEIDGKVQEILKFLKEEDDNDRKEPLVDLIGDIHNHYQSIYARYDHLTEELRKKAHINHDKDSSSSSSDSSDSDDSPKKKGKKNGKLENNSDNNTAVIKQELEMALLEVDDLKRKLAITMDEKEALYQEYQSALSKAEEAQRIIMAVNAEAENQNEEKSRLLCENTDLKSELDIANKLQNELNQKLKDMNTERESLIVEKNEKDNLQLELEAAKGELFTLKEKFESAENEIIKLSQMQKATEEENINLSSKISQLENEMKQAENKIHELFTGSSQLREKVAEKEGEISSHLEMHEAHKEETLIRVKDLEVELDSSHTQRRELEKTVEEISELQIQIEKLKEELANKSFELNKNIEEKETLQLELSSTKVELEEQVKGKNDEISEYIIQIESLKAELENKIIALERELKDRDDSLIKLHEEKNDEINQLEENIEDLKRDLEMKADEMNTMIDNMRNIEVKHRLTRQKLHITEQVLGEKEETHQSKVDKLKQEQKLLEERITLLLGIIVTYKQAQVKIVKEISEKVNNTLTGIDSFGMKFEEDYGHLESRIYEIVNELKVTKNWISESNAVKNEMKNEIASLVQQLKDEKEQELLLMGKIWELEAQSRKNEDERKSLIEKVDNLEKMILEMEKRMNEKDDGILSLSEEKREAIRQLCIWIDYHHNRYDDLKDMIVKTRGRARRQIAT